MNSTQMQRRVIVIHGVFGDVGDLAISWSGLFFAANRGWVDGNDVIVLVVGLHALLVSMKLDARVLRGNASRSTLATTIFRSASLKEAPGLSFRRGFLAHAGILGQKLLRMCISEASPIAAFWGSPQEFS